MNRFFISASIVLIVSGISAFLISANPQPKAFPVEAGPAKFFRDHDKAMAEAKKTGKPVFAFFQEIPG